jgi:hypothetical protein
MNLSKFKLSLAATPKAVTLQMKMFPSSIVSNDKNFRVGKHLDSEKVEKETLR